MAMELELLSKKVDSLMATNDSLVKSNAQQSAEIKEIKDALLGSAFTKGQGMIEVQQDHADRIQALEAVRNVDHEKRLAKLERYVVWLIATGGAMAFTIGVNVAKFITQLATTYLTHK